MRVYQDDTPIARLYNKMHKNQTLDFVLKKKAEYGTFQKAKMTLKQALEKMNQFVDPSDPDLTDVSNLVHAYQTAERARKAYPELPWLHLVALIHDVGKILYLFDEPKWAIVGDTFPVGCKFSKKCVYSDSFTQNPESYSKYGIYEPHCGLDKIHFSWGHDEYLYTVLKNHKVCSIPEIGLKIIRYHSCYPIHTEGAYSRLLNEEDKETIEWVKRFNQFDLYSKADEIKEEWDTTYYDRLINVYCPGVLAF